MLKVIGHIYSDNKENFDELVGVLKNAGFNIAYDSQTNATIIKEVVHEHEDTES